MLLMSKVLEKYVEKRVDGSSASMTDTVRSGATPHPLLPTPPLGERRTHAGQF